MSVEKTAGRFPSSLPGWKEDKAKKGQEEDTGKEREKEDVGIERTQGGRRQRKEDKRGQEQGDEGCTTTKKHK